MKKIIFIALLLVAAACNNQAPAPQNAELSQADFTKAMEKYLGTEDGQAKIGTAIQEYFKKQQKKAQEDRAKQDQTSLEDQFKNPVKVDVGNSPAKGPADAKVTIVEYSDFECPFCKRGADTVEQVLKAYPKDVRVVFKNMPLPFHKNAKPAALAALAAGKQGKFWEMHDKLFENQGKLGDALYTDSAKALGLNMEQFKKDMADPALAASIEADAKQGNEIGIQGTPGFSVNGVLVKGAYPLEHFKTIIDRWLSADPSKPAA